MKKLKIGNGFPQTSQSHKTLANISKKIIVKTENTKIAKIFADCAQQAKDKTNICMFPGCTKKSINSHIMQKNGILSSIAEDNHLWELKIDNFKQEYIGFKKDGINKIYTFFGFCNEHDASVFKKIETEGKINFDDYTSCLLFALRTLHNEIWLKQVVIKLHECVLKNEEIPMNKELLKITIEQNKLGILDMEFYKDSMWSDLKNQTQSFVFQHRQFELQEICLNASINYETPEEVYRYKVEHGKDMDRLTGIFISFFPYLGNSILLMGYHKDDAILAKPYVNSYFKENEKRTFRRLSNMFAFYVETWVCSTKFYKEKIEGLDSEFHKSMIFATEKGYGRKIFDINMFEKDFKKKFKDFIKRNVG
ncbi:hypothetical protein HUE46_01340 [Flavobacterium columnare]|uniref:hypothetical protein n=1 Tax=Flavobacterium columnare TaxID=996 RepID=UPI00177B46FA|nr:hypothetical protein [Flavobacterium columnare]QOG88770.1 hypothetical protein HUE41_01340 [Flavobacterium columnare]QOG91429.1 hypothetical protein HUE42_01335 [Flavobacterium columnare]QOG96751.1 hypothetical protein HUE44_01335 [Flavobacterium columnare]QOG99409.1 hypothetical protein HUE45_01335 [Flavobacterium columnare]QOH02070.1 hypothetical protein HUE46_01340 [Flavobacterium columnare]